MPVDPQTTSVPRWNTDISAVRVFADDPSVRCVVLISDGSSSHIRGQITTMFDASRVTIVEPDGALNETLDAALVGWRFVVIGTEAGVGKLRAQVLAAGAVEAEIVEVCTESADLTSIRRRDVFCGHCHTTTAAVVAIDGVIGCDGCKTELIVYYHFSRLHSAYLGFRADYE